MKEHYAGRPKVLHQRVPGAEKFNSQYPRKPDRSQRRLDIVPCTRCGEYKSRDQFTLLKDSRAHPWCKACRCAYASEKTALEKARTTQNG